MAKAYMTMKRYILTLLIFLSAFVAKAIGYEEARQQAWFLTDKMAYELNLTPEQCDRAYQINLDYLLHVRKASDCGGSFWQYRDADLRCVLFDWQYNLYRTLGYFFRPIRWSQSAWYYPVFNRYRYGYYYFYRPTIYVTYHGGMWHRRSRNSPSPYLGMRPQRGSGMRDLYQNRNWFGNHYVGNRPPSRPGDRPNWNNGNPKKNDRPGFNHSSMGDGKGENWRNNEHPSVPSTMDNNRPGNHGTNQHPTFNDPYTNYRQTGNSQPRTNRGGARGIGQVQSSVGDRGNARTTIQRSQGGTANRSNSTSGRGNGRSFGGIDKL